MPNPALITLTALLSPKAIAGASIFLLYALTIAGLILVIITENRNPLKTIPWIIVLLLLPGLGLLFYLIFGQDNRKQRIISRSAYKRIMKGAQSQHPTQQPSPTLPPQYQTLAALLQHKYHCNLLTNTHIQAFTNGRDKLNALLNALAAATHHIHLQYYIFSDDETGNTVKQLLIAKAQQGIQVRVLYDNVGCWNVPTRFFREMKNAGIQVHAFLKVAFPILTSKVNYRNHRKIVVIDGKIGFIGGMNLADRYVHGTSWGEWRDTHFQFQGQGVHGLQAAFLIDWFVATKHLLTDPTYYPPTTPNLPPTSPVAPTSPPMQANTPNLSPTSPPISPTSPSPIKVTSPNIMQLLSSSPVGQWRTLLQATLFVIANARKYLYIQTPYFLPTEGLNQALQTAALSGVDVRLMLPKRSDTRSAQMASRSFIDDMVKAGAKVYFYQTGFLHAKLLVSDDQLTCIGSANMDFRSFEHNFEITAFIYQQEFAWQMRDTFLRDIHNSQAVNPTRWLHRPLRHRLPESFMRLFSPLL